MGKCIYCGKEAGFIKNRHKTCETNYNSGKRAIIESVSSKITKTSDFQSFENDIKKIAGQHYIKTNELACLLTKGFDNAVETILEDGILTAEEETTLQKFKSYFNFNQDFIDRNNSLQKISKASVLRKINEGKLPVCKHKIPGFFPFLLPESEIPVWIFHDVDYYEQHVENRAGNQGNSMKVAKGIYHRSGTFKGYPVKVDEMKHICPGSLSITNKHIYFSSSHKTFTIPFNKIVACDPYEDAVGIHIEKMSAKPQVFKDLDGWFIYNLLTNLNR